MHKMCCKMCCNKMCCKMCWTHVVTVVATCVRQCVTACVTCLATRCVATCLATRCLSEKPLSAPACWHPNSSLSPHPPPTTCLLRQPRKESKDGGRLTPQLSCSSLLQTCPSTTCSAAGRGCVLKWGASTQGCRLGLSRRPSCSEKL